MENLLAKLNFKSELRICVLNAEDSFIEELSGALPLVKIDRRVGPKYTYNFILVFASTSIEMEETIQMAIHNLYDDGILWYIYPKNPAEGIESPLTRENGWDLAREAGLEPVRQICFDDKRSATRLRNKKYIRRRKRN